MIGIIGESTWVLKDDVTHWEVKDGVLTLYGEEVEKIEVNYPDSEKQEVTFIMMECPPDHRHVFIYGSLKVAHEKYQWAIINASGFVELREDKPEFINNVWTGKGPILEDTVYLVESSKSLIKLG